jgi:phospholipase D1/2
VDGASPPATAASVDTELSPLTLDERAGATARRAPSRLLVPGRNCWRIERAARVAFLVDGEAFFAAVRSALAKARRSIFIIGWDIDSRMQLVPGAHDGLPEPLAEFLNAIVAKRRELRGYVLSWDFAMLYAMEREWLPIYKLDWLTHRRLSFRLDDRHPAGASHHQKIVVVDDAVAFVSGYDLTRARWDTSAHAPRDPRRVDHRGESYGPFHDVGIAVAGDCARALGELARQRWQRATGARPRRMRSSATEDVWPDHVDPAATDVDVAIARTEPVHDGRAGVYEIRTLYVDAIELARRCIFAENQYFTSLIIADAFARRLQSDSAPEIALVSPYTQCGWLETTTMGVLRARNHRFLRAADRHDRYRMYCPALEGGECLNVHSKVIIVDDDLLIIGSANLANRSLGTDTECNVAIESGGDARLQRVIAGLRERLLAEHLDCRPEQVYEETARRGSIHAAVAALAKPSGRTVMTVEPPLDPGLDAVIPDHHVIDPEQPLHADTIVADLLPQDDVRTDTRGRLVGIAVAVVALAAMALAWRFTPLHEWLAIERLIDFGDRLSDHAWGPLAVIALYVLGGLIAFPLLLLIGVTAIVFGPLLGPLYAFIGATLSGTLTFAIGRKLGRETVRKVAGRRINELSRRLAEHGLLAIIFVRILPIAPYSVVNVVAGASHIGWRDFLLGTLIGLTPGVLTMTMFVDRAIAAIRHPSMRTFVLLAIAVAVIVVLIRMLRRKLRAMANGAHDAVPTAHGS